MEMPTSRGPLPALIAMQGLSCRRSAERDHRHVMNRSVEGRGGMPVAARPDPGADWAPGLKRQAGTGGSWGTEKV